MVFDPDSILLRLFTKDLIHLTKMRLFHGLEGRLIYQGAEASLQNDKPAAQGKIAAMATKIETPHRL